MPKPQFEELKHTVTVEKSAIDSEKKRVSLILSEETQILRSSWVHGRYKLKLKHTKEAVDLSRADILKLFYQHDTHGDRPPIGRLENVRLEDRKLKADAVFDPEDEFAMQIFGKIERGFLNSVSVGVDILDGFMTEHKSKENEYTATKWAIHEASIVNIPAIPGAKVGLSAGDERCEKCEELFSETQNNKEEKSMTKEELQKEHPEIYQEIFEAGATAERERIQAIELAVPKSYGEIDIVAQLKFDGKSGATEVQAALFAYEMKQKEKAKTNLETDGEELAAQVEGIGGEAPEANADDAKEEKLAKARSAAIEKLNKKRGA